MFDYKFKLVQFKLPNTNCLLVGNIPQLYEWFLDKALKDENIENKKILNLPRNCDIELKLVLKILILHCYMKMLMVYLLWKVVRHFKLKQQNPGF
jgi:hypothetical protein